jgi:hypothetical protein
VEHECEAVGKIQLSSTTKALEKAQPLSTRTPDLWASSSKAARTRTVRAAAGVAQ